MKQGSDESRHLDKSCGQGCLLEQKSGCNTLAYPKSKKRFVIKKTLPSTQNTYAHKNFFRPSKDAIKGL